MKGVMLVTPRCGYCTMAKNQIGKEYPDLNSRDFDYVDLTKDNGPETNSMIQMLQMSAGLRGVPATILIETNDGKKTVTKLVRGYNMDGIRQIIDTVLDNKPKSKQLELEFPE